MISDPFMEEFMDEDYDPFLNKARANLKDWLGRRKRRRTERKKLRAEKRSKVAPELKQKPAASDRQTLAKDPAGKPAGEKAPDPSTEEGQAPAGEEKRGGYGMIGIILVGTVVMGIIFAISKGSGEKEVHVRGQ